jgi:hypothetical protein
LIDLASPRSFHLIAEVSTGCGAGTAGDLEHPLSAVRTFKQARRNCSVRTGIECHVSHPNCLSYFSMNWSERWTSITTGSPSSERLRVSDPTKRRAKPYADSHLGLGLSLFSNSWKDRVWRARYRARSLHTESDLGSALI